MLIAILLGVILGSLASGFIGWYLWFTRSSRRARNKFVIYFGQLVTAVSALGSLFLLGEVLRRIGVPHESQGRWASAAYVAGVAGVLFPVLRSEVRWRKSFQSKKKSGNDAGLVLTMVSRPGGSAGSLGFAKTMTQSEFISQLDDMKKRGRKLIAFGLVVSFVSAASAFYWFFFYRPSASKTGLLISTAVYMIVWGLACALVVFSLRRHATLYSPKCPACNRPLTWGERASVLDDKQCPFCHAEVIREPGA